MESVSSPAAPPPAGPYSPGIVSNGLLFLAGQGPFDAQGQRVGTTFAEQARQTFENLEAVAQAAGGSLRNAVRIGVYLNDIGDFPEMNAIATEYLSEPFPARTTLRVDLTGFDIEIDAVIELP